MVAPPIHEADEYSIRNRTQLKNSVLAGCYYCEHTFPAEEVTEFIPEPTGEPTAWCPRCGIDAVLGDAAVYPLNSTTLSELHRFWFGAPAEQPGL